MAISEDTGSYADKTYLWLGATFVIGILLRVYNLGFQSIWIDEAFSIYNAQHSVASIISLQDTSPPLYHLLLHLWIQAFGTSAIAARSLSVVFGSLLIIATYLLAAYLFDKEVGIIASMLVAISPLFIYFSQEARAYCLFFLLSVIKAVLNRERAEVDISYRICHQHYIHAIRSSVRGLHCHRAEHT